METFSIKESIRFGWKTFWARPWLFILAGVAVTAVNMLFSLPQSILDSAAETAADPQALQLAIFSLLFSLVGFVVSFFIQLGTLNFLFKAHDELPTAKVKDLLYFKDWGAFILASLLVMVIVLVGFLLLIIPGIILSLALALTLYLVVDRGLGPVAAIKESMRLTKGKRLKLLGFTLATVGINILGFLALLVGLAVTIPVSMLAWIHAYRVLAAKDATPETTAPVTVEPVVV